RGRASDHGLRPGPGGSTRGGEHGPTGWADDGRLGDECGLLPVGGAAGGAGGRGAGLRPPDGGGASGHQAGEPAAGRTRRRLGHRLRPGATAAGRGEPDLTGDLVGTLRYMSPEQALAKRVVIDHRTDVYSLGATLYELLTLRPAFGGSDRQELLRQVAFDEPPSPRKVNRAIPQELETVVLKAMAKNPPERYGTAGELADRLGPLPPDQ